MSVAVIEVANTTVLQTQSHSDYLAIQVNAKQSHFHLQL